jgi:hypothetical protein
VDQRLGRAALRLLQSSAINLTELTAPNQTTAGSFSGFDPARTPDNDWALSGTWGQTNMNGGRRQTPGDDGTHSQWPEEACGDRRMGQDRAIGTFYYRLAIGRVSLNGFGA